MLSNLGHHSDMARDLAERRKAHFVAWMQANDLNPPSLYEKAGIPKTTIYSYLDGKARSMKGETEAAIAAAFDLPIEAIFGDSGSGFKDPNFVSAWRERLGVSIDDLARRIGTTTQVMALVEGGEISLSQKWLRRVGDALGVRAGYLMDDPALIPDEVLEQFGRRTVEDDVRAIRVMDAVRGAA